MAMHIQTTIERSDRFTKTNSSQPFAARFLGFAKRPDDIDDPRRHHQTRGGFVNNSRFAGKPVNSGALSASPDFVILLQEVFRRESRLHVSPVSRGAVGHLSSPLHWGWLP